MKPKLSSCVILRTNRQAYAPSKQDIKGVFSGETYQPMAKYWAGTDFGSLPDSTAAAPSDHVSTVRAPDFQCKHNGQPKITSQWVGVFNIKETKPG